MMELMEKTEEELSSSEKKLRGCIMVGGGELMVTERFCLSHFCISKTASLCPVQLFHRDYQ